MWVLLSATKKKCWRTWLLFVGLILALSLVQTISGKLDGIMLFAWTLIGAMILPGFISVYISILLDRQSARIIPKEVSLILQWGTRFYLLILLITLMAEGSVVSFSSLSMYEYRMKSLIWIIPIELILVIGYFLIFFKREALFQPNVEAIKKIAAQHAEKWGEKHIALKEECLELISKAEVEEALALYKKEIKETGVGDLNKVILLESQFNENKQKVTLGINSPEESQRTQNRIMMAFIQLLEVD